MRRIRIAQIGINKYSHGVDLFETLRALPELFDIAGYALVEDERITCADKLSVFEGYRELTLEEILKDDTVEAVAIETDEVHLTKYATMAVRAGKHVHMEKPGSPDGVAFDRLIDAVKESGRAFHIGYMYRYHPYISDAITKATSGDLGEIFSVEAQMSRYDGEEVRRWLGEFPGGMMFYLGCHLVDIVLRIQGIPEKIIPLSRPVADGFGADYGMAVLEYKNGVSFVKAAGVELGGNVRRQLVINGAKGSVEIRPLESRVKGKGYTFTSTKRETWLESGSTDSTSEPFDRYAPMMCAFAAMVRGEVRNPYTPDYEKALFHILLACCGAEEYRPDK